MREWVFSSSVLILAVNTLRSLLKKKLSARLSYALWALVLIRLLIPVGIGRSPVSIANLLSVKDTNTATDDRRLSVTVIPGTGEIVMPDYHSDGSVTESVENAASADAVTEPPAEGADAENKVNSDGNEHAAPSVHGKEAVQTAEKAKQNIGRSGSPLSLTRLADIIWGIGAAAILTVFSAVNITFSVRLHRSRRRIEDCRADVPVYISSVIEAPCLFGILRPAVYVTPTAAEDTTMLLHSVEHECTHLRHFDNIWSMLRSVCLILHWYNPLVWVAAILSRNDSELACDEGTLQRIGPMQRTAYGMTLIRLTCRRSESVFLTATTMAGRENFLRQRVTRIVSHSKPRVWASVVAAAACLILVGCTFTGAVSGANTDAFPSETTDEISVTANSDTGMKGASEITADTSTANLPEITGVPAIAPCDITSLTSAQLELDGKVYTITDKTSLTALSEILSGCENLGKPYETAQMNKSEISVLNHPYYATLTLYNGDDGGYIRVSTDGTRLMAGADDLYYQYFGSRECIWDLFGARLPFRLLPAPLHCVSGGSDVVGQLVGGAWESVEDKAAVLSALEDAPAVPAAPDIHFCTEDETFTGGPLWIYDENGNEVDLGPEGHYSIPYIVTLSPGRYIAVSQSAYIAHLGNQDSDVDYLVTSYAFFIDVTEENSLECFDPNDIHDIVSAVCYCRGEAIELNGLDNFDSLMANFAGAQKLGYGTACGFGMPMVLTDSTERRGVLFPAEDGCNVFYNGNYWETEEHLLENREIGKLLNKSYTVEVRDEGGRLLRSTDYHNGSPSSGLSYEYTEDGRLSVRRRFNEYGNETESVVFGYADNEVSIAYRSMGELYYINTYKYEGDRIVSCTHKFPDGSETMTEYLYDSEGRLIADSGSYGCTVYIYNEAGLVQYEDVYNVPYSASLSSPYQRTEYSYDDNGRLTTSRFDIADGKKQHLGWDEYEYIINDGEEEIWWTRYDANGKVTERYQVTSAFVFSGRPEVDIISDYYPE